MKRAPTKKRLAILLDDDGNVAGLADDRASFASVELYEEGAEDSSTLELDDDEEPVQLADELDEMGATDIVALWYEDIIYGSLHGEGFTLWLVPSETTREEAIREWHENTLTRAEAGVEVRRKGHLLHTAPIERPE
jgi:hypothetical protein